MWEQCQLLKTAWVFARCHPLVDPEPFVALCEKTLCTCFTGPECACPVLLEYARTCAQEGMVLYHWTDHSACRKSLVSPVLEQAACLGVVAQGALESCCDVRFPLVPSASVYPA